MAAFSHVKSNAIADFTGTVTVFNSAGNTATVAATDLVRPSDWNSIHNFFNTITGNTLGTSTASGTNLAVGATGGVSVSHSTAAGVATMWISAPNSSSLAAQGIISFSSNGSTISISAPGGYLSEFVYPDHVQTAVSAFGAGTMSLQAIFNPDLITATKAALTISFSGATAANTSSAGVLFSIWAGIYTRTGSTLNSVSTASTTFSTFWQSASTSSVNGGRELSLPFNVNLTPGAYIFMFNLSTATGGQTSAANTISVFGANNLQTAMAIAAFGANTATSVGPFRGMGLYSVVTNAVPAAISMSGINATGANLSRANIAIGLYNQ